MPWALRYHERRAQEFLFAVSLVALLSGCHLAQWADRCVPIGDLTSIVIHGGRGRITCSPLPSRFDGDVTCKCTSGGISAGSLHMPAPRTIRHSLR